MVIFCSVDSNETCTVHFRTNNTEILIVNKTDEIIKELFEFLLQKY